jgi:hypothetical protein
VETDLRGARSKPVSEIRDALSEAQRIDRVANPLDRHATDSVRFAYRSLRPEIATTSH